MKNSTSYLYADNIEEDIVTDIKPQVKASTITNEDLKVIGAEIASGTNQDLDLWEGRDGKPYATLVFNPEHETSYENTNLGQLLGKIMPKLEGTGRYIALRFNVNGHNRIGRVIKHKADENSLILAIRETASASSLRASEPTVMKAKAPAEASSQQEAQSTTKRRLPV